MGSNICKWQKHVRNNRIHPAIYVNGKNMKGIIEYILQDLFHKMHPAGS
jgi:hypothetical protein